jgi:hypothetical protein
MHAMMFGGRANWHGFGVAFLDFPATDPASHHLSGCLASGKHFTERELP